MGDPRNPRFQSFSLPPGCGFYPSDEQIFDYLSFKNTKKEELSNCNPYNYDLMKELDLYDYDPYELPDSACFGYGYKNWKKHWYCYTVMGLKESGRGKRKTKGGYWRKGRTVVVSRGKAMLGTRSIFAFYLVDSNRIAAKTDWVLYEYAQLENLKTTFVLCRVFLKFHHWSRLSDNALICDEQNSSPLHHTGVHHVGYLAKAKKEHYNISVDGKNDKTRYPQTQLCKLGDCHVICKPVSQPIELMRANVVGGDDISPSPDAISAQELMSILDDDFIELDDLVD